MKELSIEEKAKRYDEAIERAKNYYSTTDSASVIKLIGLIFPELKESEDDRIREAIHIYLDWLDGRKDYAPRGEYTIRDMIAWVEKQAEHDNFRNKIQIGDKVIRNKDGVLVNLSQLNRVAKKDEKQGEQKPAGNSGKKSEDVIEEKDMTEYKKGFECGKQYVLKYPEEYNLCKNTAWSEEDEKILSDIIKDLVHPWNEYIPDRIEDEIKWLKNKFKSLKDRVQPQTKQEWSEEDESMLYGVIETEQYMLDVVNGEKTFDVGNEQIESQCTKELAWLKILKDRYTWKPSDEQMNALNYVVNLMASSERPTENDLYYNILKSLRQQLKKHYL